MRQHIEANFPPLLPLRVDHGDLLAGVAAVVAACFPRWDVTADCTLAQHTDGITNKLVRCTHIPSNTAVLIRTYGTGTHILIDRTQELVNMVALADRRLSPPLYARFINGIVYGYAHGAVFSVADMRDQHKSSLVARHLAKWHTITLPSVPRKPQLFTTLRRWIDAIPSRYAVQSRTDKVAAMGISVDSLRVELDALQSHLATVASPVVFCHCDLLPGNIVLLSNDVVSNHNDGDGDDAHFHQRRRDHDAAPPMSDSVAFIDYEYGCYSYRGFDIGNHFCEWAGFDCDWTLYPTEAQQRRWIRTYLEAFAEAEADAKANANGLSRSQGDFADRLDTASPAELMDVSERTVSASEPILHTISSNEKNNHKSRLATNPHTDAHTPTITTPETTTAKIPVDDAVVTSLYNEVKHYTLAAHFFWATWALVQAEISDLDFDYIQYASKRFDAYYRHRRELMG